MLRPSKMRRKCLWILPPPVWLAVAKFRNLGYSFPVLTTNWGILLFGKILGNFWWLFMLWANFLFRSSAKFCENSGMAKLGTNHLVTLPPPFCLKCCKNCFGKRQRPTKLEIMNHSYEAKILKDTFLAVRVVLRGSAMRAPTQREPTKSFKFFSFQFWKKECHCFVEVDDFCTSGQKLWDGPTWNAAKLPFPNSFSLKRNALGCPTKENV